MISETKVKKNFGKILYLNSITFIDPEKVKDIRVYGYNVDIILADGATYTLKNVLRAYERYTKSLLLADIYGKLDVSHSEFNNMTRSLTIRQLEGVYKKIIGLEEENLFNIPEDLREEALIPVLDENGNIIDVEPLLIDDPTSSLYEPDLLQEQLEKAELMERGENSTEKYERLFEEGRSRRSPIKID